MDGLHDGNQILGRERSEALVVFFLHAALQQGGRGRVGLEGILVDGVGIHDGIDQGECRALRHDGTQVVGRGLVDGNEQLERVLEQREQLEVVLSFEVVLAQGGNFADMMTVDDRISACVHGNLR